MTTEDVWEIIPKSSLPTSAHIIWLLWSFKIKRNPFGQLTKHKAHLCVHGGMQEKEIDLNNKFAPVVNGSTVNLIIIIADMDLW